VTIAYPKSEDDILTFDNDVQQHINALEKEVSVLAIHDGYYYSPMKINAHILRENKAMILLSAVKKRMENRSKNKGTYYAKMIS
jgi:hypothetical protein